MLSCVDCQLKACYKEVKETVPKDCPLTHQEVVAESRLEYEDERIIKLAREAALTESEGYLRWTRVEEIIHLCQRMEYQKLGLAFCRSMRNEAEIAAKILRSHGFTVVAANCKFSSIPKEFIGVKDREKIHPGTFEPMCNPIGQAKILNEAKTDFNIVLGLCVGHDSLFYKYSEALCTVMVAKDRALAHNPAAALYCSDGYFKRLYKPKE